jgi:hypothetical protein
MNRWRVGEDMGSKEMDRCPLTVCITTWNSNIAFIIVNWCEQVNIAA